MSLRMVLTDCVNNGKYGPLDICNCLWCTIRPNKCNSYANVCEAVFEFKEAGLKLDVPRFVQSVFARDLNTFWRRGEYPRSRYMKLSLGLTQGDMKLYVTQSVHSRPNQSPYTQTEVKCTCSVVYTASPLQFEQCSWSVHCPCSIPYTAGCRVHCSYTPPTYCMYTAGGTLHRHFTPLRSVYPSDVVFWTVINQL